MLNTKAQYMANLWARFEALRAQKVSVDMTRGNPCPEQLALSDPMLTIRDVQTAEGVDCRNYGGGPFGLPEARKFAARYLGTSPKRTIVLGSSSLTLMHDVIVQHLVRPRAGWGRSDGRIKFICPVPGYDRHLVILERYGIEMISVPMGENGPDLKTVIEAVRDPSVVGMWLVPKYSNPTGVTCKPVVARALAQMKTACPSFVVMVDDAYRHHDFTSTPERGPDFMRIARTAGTEDRFFVFGSLSKVTFAGAGLAMMATSQSNLEWFAKSLQVQTIGPDKLNQLRHVRFLPDMRALKAHMKKHRRIVEPKFRAVYDTLEKYIGGKGIATWTKPEGGYFISLNLTHGSAKRMVELSGLLGVKLTPAGAAFPYGNDLNDNHLRLAPTYPPTEELVKGIERAAVAAEIAHREKHPW